MHLSSGGRATRSALMVLLLSPVLGGGDCDTNVVELDPVMLVEPSGLDFGFSAISQDSLKTFRVSNPSALSLQLEVVLSLDSDPAFALVNPPAVVAAGDSVDIQVRFRPMLPTQVTGTVQLSSDSKKYPRAQVALVGGGVDRGLPDIVVEPVPLDFGAVGLGVVVRADLRVANAGVRDLVIDDVVLTDDGQGAFVLVTTAPAGYVLRPGDELFLKLAFNPPLLGDFFGELTITSNDPDASVVRLVLKGSGYDTPVAVISTLDPTDTLEPLDTVRLDGSQSYSPTPNVSIAGYEWRLAVRPQGSTAVLRADGNSGVELVQEQPRADLLLDLAGRYEVLLYVVDSRGVRSGSPDLLRLRAVPDEDLHIQLVWDHPTADLDLHVVRGRSGLFDHDTDCYFSNRYPDWYVENPDANPRLDVDDQGGFGPENVNVVRPMAGVATVFVHYWDARTAGDPTVNAVVRVYVRGQLGGEFSKTFSADERMWSAVELDWPATPDAPVPLTPLGTVVEYRRPF
ncbi:MAG: choice-of-anchor D domain-containing protein [Pseudomonadota bacterium]